MNDQKDKLSMPYIANGWYRHYKGNCYLVFGIIWDCDTDCWKILYGIERPEYTRSYENFIEWIKVNEQFIPRFQRIKPQQGEPL